MIAVLGYVGDALSVLALSMMFSLSLAIHRAQPQANRLAVWALPVLAVAISFPLGFAARTWPQDLVGATVVLGARAVVSALLAILHLNGAQRR